MIAKALGRFAERLKARLKNHPEVADAINFVTDYLKTASPGQVSALDWKKASVLFAQAEVQSVYNTSQEASLLPAPKPNGAIGGTKKPPSQAMAPDTGSPTVLATAVILGLKICSEFLQSGDSLDVLLPTGDKTQGMGRDPQKNVEDAVSSKVPNQIVAARCKAISQDFSPVALAAEASFAIGLVRSIAEAQESDVEPNEIDMIMHMAELVLSDLHDGLDSVPIPSPEDTSLILGIPLQPSATNGALSKSIQQLSYSVDEILEGIVKLDTSTSEAFMEGLTTLAEGIEEIDSQVAALQGGGEDEAEGEEGEEAEVEAEEDEEEEPTPLNNKESAPSTKGTKKLPAQIHEEANDESV